jgi:integrase-like protein
MAAWHSSGCMWHAPAAGAPLASTLVARETGPAEAPKPRLLDRVREAIRARHYSRRTEKACVDWIKRYIFFFHHKRNPMEMGVADVTAFRTSMAVQGETARAHSPNNAIHRTGLALLAPRIERI